MSDVRMQLAALLERAIPMVEGRLNKAPGFAPLSSALAQLRKMKADVDANTSPSREERNSITLGVLAAREFETDDLELADTLVKAEYLYNRL